MGEFHEFETIGAGRIFGTDFGGRRIVRKRTHLSYPMLCLSDSKNSAKQRGRSVYNESNSGRWAHGSCEKCQIRKRSSALDHFDLKLLAALEADGRLTNSELADKVGLSASQCSRRRIRLEDSRHHRRLFARGSTPGAWELAFSPSIQVSMSPHSKENAKKFSDFVNTVEEIQEAYALTGDCGLSLESGGAGLKEPVADHQ